MVELMSVIMNLKLVEEAVEVMEQHHMEEMEACMEPEAVEVSILLEGKDQLVLTEAVVEAVVMEHMHVEEMEVTMAEVLEVLVFV